MSDIIEENVVFEETDIVEPNKEVEEKKEIEIVSDDGSSLNISGVSDTINIVKHDDDKPKNIVIPQGKK
jgi:hypothetical protein